MAAIPAAERQPPQKREESLLSALPNFIAHAQAHSPIYAKRLRDIEASAINSREALAQLPITTKDGLINEQEENPPFGGYACAKESAARVYMSPGPIAECEFDEADYWRTASALRAAGFGAGMLLHNAFSYHFTPAGMMCDQGARVLGGRVFPAGVGNSAQHAVAMARLRPHCYTGTPDFLLTILQQADDAGLEVSSLRTGTVSGGYLSPQLRREYNDRGINILQWYGSADIGCIAFESDATEPMIVAEGLLVEIVSPISRQPISAGEKGEVLVTNFNRNYPLIRFSLGDLSAVAAGISPCGRTNMRLQGWLGRCAPSVKIKGMFVHPAQIERLAATLTDYALALQLSVTQANGRDQMTLRCVANPAQAANDALVMRLQTALENETKLRGKVAFVANIEGDLIVDERG